ncbi:hypothetical protein [Erythrobacter crassostreae]|uniref:Sulfotransferase domain-containing protein n=1 Tax=Erythrobacter crassostreae TaxID=2828328 RepID=A0A9X1JKM5_9SPHN|nr:hypothetical protein [Erythrobacter crassostrea]MBV7259225.1 hypothetical protein [Erythrobacter crassostrea]
MQLKLRAALGRFSEAYIAIQRVRYRLPFDGGPNKLGLFRLLNDETEIVIEGFPRSANSWTLRLFRHWQGRRMHIAEHQHSEAHILAGAKRGLPVIVLIRWPQDAIRSWAQHDSGLDLVWALRRWIGFYQAVETVSDKVVIATFEQATQTFGEVVERTNEKFGSNFKGGVIDDKLREEITSQMAVTGYPDPERRARLKDVADRLDPKTLEGAMEIYETLAAKAH